VTDYQTPGSQPVPSYGSGYPAAEPKTLSIVSLALGLASIFLGISILVPIAGIVVGVMARKREPAGRTMALWGIWLSVAALVIGALLWILVGGFILAALGFAATGA
jgi:Domain of unknown function (DUF4190)